MAAKKKSAKKTSAKKEKKVTGKAKAKKATRSAAPKAQARKPRSASPTSGQSGPPLTLVKEKLNSKETKVVASLQDDANPVAINGLAAACFSNQSAKTANSWVRNSLRRLVRGKWVEKVGKGTYRLTEAGRNGTNGVVVSPSTPAPASEPASEPEPAVEAAQPSA